jgi:transcriptional regulator with XRE-family HTH domain
VLYIAIISQDIFMLLKIKELRTKKKISQEILALKTGISKRMILDYEREIKDIPLQKLQLIAIALEVSIFDLVELNDNEKPKRENNTTGFETEIAIRDKMIQMLEFENQRLKYEVAELKGLDKSRTA